MYDILHIIHKGNTKREIIDAGNTIKNLNISLKYSFSIQERIMKVTAMAGLLQLSCTILDSMVISKNHIPSSIGYVAVLNGLRKVKQLDVLQKTMINLSKACSGCIEEEVVVEEESNKFIETVALNTYLGALCDDTSNNDSLVEAMELLRPNIAKDRYSIRDGPDTCSYNTVLNAAISSYPKNSTMIMEVLELMKTNNVIEDIYTFNLRLKACGNNQMATEEKIVIIDKILSHPFINPDRFTIEQILLPLARKGRVGDILDILKVFNLQEQSASSVSNAYSTFLIALVKVSCRYNQKQGNVELYSYSLLSIFTN